MNKELLDESVRNAKVALDNVASEGYRPTIIIALKFNDGLSALSLDMAELRMESPLPLVLQARILRMALDGVEEALSETEETILDVLQDVGGGIASA